jgi:hypothetical protein
MSTPAILFTPSQDALETARWLANDYLDDKVDDICKGVEEIVHKGEYSRGVIVMGLLSHICEVIDLADRDCRKDLYEAVTYLLALCADDKEVTNYTDNY